MRFYKVVCVFFILTAMVCGSALANNGTTLVHFEKESATAQAMVRSEETGVVCDLEIDHDCMPPLPPIPGQPLSLFDIANDEWVEDQNPAQGMVSADAFVDVPAYGHNTAGVFWSADSDFGGPVIHLSADGWSYGMPGGVEDENHISRYATGGFSFALDAPGAITATVNGWAGQSTSDQDVVDIFSFIIAKVVGPHPTNPSMSEQEEVVYRKDSSNTEFCKRGCEPGDVWSHCFDPMCDDPNYTEFSDTIIFEPGVEYKAYIYQKQP